MSTSQIKLPGTPKDQGRLIYCCKCEDFAFSPGAVELAPGKVICFDHWHQRHRARQVMHINRHTKERK